MNGRSFNHWHKYQGPRYVLSPSGFIFPAPTTSTIKNIGAQDAAQALDFSFNTSTMTTRPTMDGVADSKPQQATVLRST